MALELTPLTAALGYIAALGDNPITDNNLTAQQLKERFDQASLDIQDYINNTLIAELEQAFNTLVIGNANLAVDAVEAGNIKDGEVTETKLASTVKPENVGIVIGNDDPEIDTDLIAEGQIYLRYT